MRSCLLQGLCRGLLLLEDLGSHGKPVLQYTLDSTDDKKVGLLTLCCGMHNGEDPSFPVFGRRKNSLAKELIARLCGRLEKSSVNRCCRHALAGHMMRPVAALVRRPVVPTFILVYRYASEQI